MAGEKKCSPTTASGRDVAAAIVVDVQIAGVRREDRARLGEAVELAEHLLLDRHVLEHRLDDQVGGGQRVEVERRGQQAHPRLDVGRRHPALGGGVLVILADRRDAAVERLLLRLDDRHRHAGVEEVHRDPAAHRARADDADAGDRQQRRIGVEAVDLVRLALGEEHVALRLRLQPGHQADEQLALDRHAFVERQRCRRLDAGDVRLGRFEAAERLGVGLAVGVEHAGLDAEHRLVADPVQRQVLVEHPPREVDRAVAQVVDDGVDQPARRRRLGTDVLAGGDHLERQLRADDARQALRPAGTGEQAELDFGQAELRRDDGDAVVADERDLEPAAERGAVDRGDDRLRAVFDRRLHVGERRPARRLAEFGDVGARR